MAIAGVAAGDDDAVGAVSERLQKQHEVDSPCAGQTDHPDIGRVLDAAGPGQVGAGVRTPVADEGDDFGLESTHDCTP